MAKYLMEQLSGWVGSLAAQNMAAALAVVAVLAVLSGLLLAMVLRLLRTVLPWLVAAAAISLLWYAGVLQRCWQWLLGLGG